MPVAMLLAGAEEERENTEEASYGDAERLVKFVGNLPLAIDHAASYIRDFRRSAKEMLDIYKSEDVMEVRGIR